ncbi:MAG: hypothetical protein UGF89_06045, partial [Acutalibacteraceae bacterium]|nr:hypothetical protein [Acutalibacteraceae bacterium]
KFDYQKPKYEVLLKFQEALQRGLPARSVEIETPDEECEDLICKPKQNEHNHNHSHHHHH